MLTPELQARVEAAKSMKAKCEPLRSLVPFLLADLDLIIELAALVESLGRDAERMNKIEDENWTLQVGEIRFGSDDADPVWEITDWDGHRIAQGDTPREAIDAAIHLSEKLP